MTRAGRVRRVVWHGVLLAPALLVLAGGLVAAWYLGTWTHEGRWLEATRDGALLRMQIERWIRFRWIHEDCRYWILPVLAGDGPLVVEGRPPEGLYWSLTYYVYTEVNPLVSSEHVTLAPDGTFRITLGPERDGPNWIPLRPDVGRIVLYLRVYEPTPGRPTRLPTVTQAGRVLVRGGEMPVRGGEG